MLVQAGTSLLPGGPAAPVPAASQQVPQTGTSTWLQPNGTAPAAAQVHPALTIPAPILMPQAAAGPATMPLMSQAPAMTQQPALAQATHAGPPASNTPLMHQLAHGHSSHTWGPGGYSAAGAGNGGPSSSYQPAPPAYQQNYYQRQAQGQELKAMQEELQRLRDHYQHQQMQEEEDRRATENMKKKLAHAEAQLAIANAELEKTKEQAGQYQAELEQERER